MTPNRRSFFRSSIGGLASVLFAGRGAAIDAPVEIAPPPHPAIPVHLDRLTPQETLFLTWQRDPTTTITVQWIAPPTEKLPAVRVAPRDDEGEWKSGTVTTKPFGPSEVRVHRCEFTRLTPGTEYLLQIGTSSQVSCFRTMPAKATDTFTFVSGGDCGVNAHAIANNILAAKQEPYFALIGGDLGYDNGTLRRDQRSPSCRNYTKHMIDPKGRLIPHGHLHRQPRGRRRLQGEALAKRTVLPAAVRRPLPRHHLRRARLRRLPQPGAARHRPRLADRRRADRLARAALRERVRIGRT